MSLGLLFIPVMSREDTLRSLFSVYFSQEVMTNSARWASRHLVTHISNLAQSWTVSRGVATIRPPKHVQKKFIYLCICIVSVFSCSDLWHSPQENMGNGIFEALKLKMPPDPLRVSRHRRTFHYASVCIPKTDNHATPLVSWWYWFLSPLRAFYWVNR